VINFADATEVPQSTLLSRGAEVAKVEGNLSHCSEGQVQSHEVKLEILASDPNFSIRHRTVVVLVLR
jgi:hypothetical protein